MQFFQAQDRARNQTGLLFFYLTLAIISMMIVLDGLLIVLLQESMDVKIHSIASVFKRPEIWYFNLGITAIILLPTIYQLIVLSHGGGTTLAKQIEAVPILPGTQNLKEQTLIHVIEEMSIAAGIPIPQLYLLEEPGINAFVAGTQPNNTILVVTRGALNTLTRDELQGVIGHEFSHIFNRDMQVNIKLLGILSGLYVLTQAGYFLMRLNSSAVPNQHHSKSRANTNFRLALLGIGIYCIGLLGLIFGRIIKAAILRQRELLADASGVQFTRNPIGLVGALVKIQNHTSELKSHHAESISHFCIASPIKRYFGFSEMGDLLSTHPPIAKRLKALDPTGELQNQVNSLAKPPI